MPKLFFDMSNDNTVVVNGYVDGSEDMLHIEVQQVSGRVSELHYGQKYNVHVSEFLSQRFEPLN